MAMSTENEGGDREEFQAYHSSYTPATQNMNSDEEEDETSSLVVPIKDHRWIIILSILIRRILSLFAKPLKWFGCFVDFVLNLWTQNGNLLGLLCNLLRGEVVIPKRGSDTFISAFGHLDSRIDLYKGIALRPEMGNKTLMDLCIMASKLAYENALVIKRVVNHHWKMHFADFCDGWNDYQKEFSTQAFILCDKPKDANLILIVFRGTELFNANDWKTDMDFSWFKIPNVGKVHIGFLEALGLGNRVEPTTFQYNLINKKNRKSKFSNDVNVGAYSSEIVHSGIDDSDEDERDCDNESSSSEKIQRSAYYTLISKLKSLLKEHKNAKIIFTGHSLGGALAILFPTVLVVHEEKEIMERLLGVYTFGQPRIGDRKLGEFMEVHLEKKYFRVVYCNDLVPRLPFDDKTFMYKHFGVCLYYNSLYREKEVKEEPNRNFFGMRFVLSNHGNAVWELIRGLTMGYFEGPEYKEGWLLIFIRVMGLAFPGVSAHCITDYVNSIRLGNNISIQMSTT